MEDEAWRQQTAWCGLSDWLRPGGRCVTPPGIDPRINSCTTRLCRSGQRARVRNSRAARKRPAGLYFCGPAGALVAAGGVAANQAIRKVLQRLAMEVGTTLVAPPLELTADVLFSV